MTALAVMDPLSHRLPHFARVPPGLSALCRLAIGGQVHLARPEVVVPGELEDQGGNCENDSAER